MRIGVLKERKRDERRVALRPDQVAILIDGRNQVWVEEGAGKAAGYSDDDYAKAGGNIVSQQEVYDRSVLLLKVKCPLEEEYKYLLDTHILFAYLHFDENILPAKIKQIIGTGVTGIAYEWVQCDGVFPLLQPMSELSGAIFARKAMTLLMRHKGVLGGMYLPNWPSATAMVIGTGHIGANAVNVFLRNRYRLVVVDKHPETLSDRLRPYVDLKQWADNDKEVVKFDEDAPCGSTARIRRHLPQSEIVICAAVRRSTLPKEKCEYLIRREDMALIGQNGVICDATACTRDFIETCVGTEGLDETYTEEGVVHYNCDHAPSSVARTASNLLTEATFPYIKLLSEEGFEGSIQKSPALAKGVMCYGKRITHEYSARKKKLDFSNLSDMLTW